ncbi:kinase-like domain-containing protein [Tuber brumale]|nr:kinase-like domain-containing protein [Tuber brumale]
MGDGAFSNVYRAMDIQGECGEVAIKVVRKYELGASQNNGHLHPDFRKVPKTVERANILKEVQIMRGLNHPNIVSLISFSESPSYYYLVLELCPGGELFHQIVRLTYFSENLSRHVIVQVAEALRHLHEEKGVVHRDIKPENLLFDPIPFIPTKNPKPRAPDDEDKVDEGEFLPGIGAGGIGRIKVADFGLSKVVWDKQTMTPCGTVGYTAPEIIKDERYSKSVDMWAMGCVLYTLLCGFPPFYDESISVLTDKVARGQYTFLSPWWDDISKSAQDLVSHLLTVDPEKRYTIHQFMAHPWIRGTDEETTAALDAPPLATPAIRSANKAFTPMAVEPDFGPDMGGPGAAKRMDFRSPGVVSLREVFDVGYAVHRMEEEGKRRKNWKQGYRGGPQPLNEEDEFDSEDDEVGEPVKIPKESDADDVAGMEQTLRQTDLNARSTYAGSVVVARGAGVSGLAKQQQAGGDGGAKQATTPLSGRTRRKLGGPFELSLDNATLLGRRKKADQHPLIGV